MEQIAQQSIRTFLFAFYLKIHKNFCICLDSCGSDMRTLTVNALGLTVQLAIGVGSKT